MEAFREIEKPDYRKYRLLRECLADVRGLVPEDAATGAPPAAASPAPAPKPVAGLRLDGIANGVVVCIGVAVVVAAAVTEGLHATLSNLA